MCSLFSDVREEKAAPGAYFLGTLPYQGVRKNVNDLLTFNAFLGAFVVHRDC